MRKTPGDERLVVHGVYRWESRKTQGAFPMIRKDVVKDWLETHPFDGRAALLIGVLAVGVPTGLRAAVDGVVTGVPISGYVPFVLMSAVLLGWWNATLVALASAILGDALFVGQPNHLLEGPDDVFIVGLFLFVSGVVIGLSNSSGACLQIAGPHPRQTSRPGSSSAWSVGRHGRAGTDRANRCALGPKQKLPG